VERTTIAGETEELGENLPERHFVPPQIPHDQVGLDLDTNSVFTLGPRNTTEYLGQFGRSHDIKDANWLVTSSPPFNDSPCLYCCFIYTYLSCSVCFVCVYVG
jgi:hypothetical protein